MSNATRQPQEIFFPAAGKDTFQEGRDSNNPLAFKWYDGEQEDLQVSL